MKLILKAPVVSDFSGYKNTMKYYIAWKAGECEYSKHVDRYGSS